MISRFSRFLSAVLFVLLVSCHGPAKRSIEIVPSPARIGSGEGNLARGGDGRLYLSWIESQGTRRTFLFSRWNENAWSAPRIIIEGDSVAGNWTDLPGMTAFEDGTLLAYWQVQHGHAFDIRYALSGDGGQTWGFPSSLHPSSTAGHHAFVSAAALSPREIGLIWLDGDESAGSPPMTLRFARIDADAQHSHESVIDSRVCDCCPTDLVAAAGGTLLAIYRDRSETEIRDMTLARYENGTWTEGSTVHADRWKIAGCPVNGPALDTDGTRVAAAWYTADANDRAHVRAAFSPDEGRTFGKPIEIAGENPMGRVDLALGASGETWVSWLEGARENPRFYLRSIDKQGQPGLRLTVPSNHTIRGLPRVGSVNGELFLVWTEEGAGPDSTQVLTARLR